MGKFIRGHVERMLAGAVTTVIDLDVLKCQRTRVSIGAENAMGRTIMNDGVANGNVVRVMVDSAEATAGYIESFEDIVIRETKFDSVRPPRNNRPQAINPKATNRNLIYHCAGSGEDEIAGVRRVAVNFNKISWRQQRCNILQSRKRSGWSHLIGNRKCAAAADGYDE
jgi:hypothetical protein